MFLYGRASDKKLQHQKGGKLRRFSARKASHALSPRAGRWDILARKFLGIPGPFPEPQRQSGKSTWDGSRVPGMAPEVPRKVPGRPGDYHRMHRKSHAKMSHRPE